MDHFLSVFLPSSTNVAAMSLYHHLEDYKHVYHSAQTQGINVLNINSETLNAVKEKLGHNLEHIGRGHNFLTRKHIVQALKWPANKWLLMKLKASARQRTPLFGANGISQIGKVFTKLAFFNKVISKIYEELKKLDTKNSNNPCKNGSYI